MTQDPNNPQYRGVYNQAKYMSPRVRVIIFAWDGLKVAASAEAFRIGWEAIVHSRLPIEARMLYEILLRFVIHFNN